MCNYNSGELNVRLWYCGFHSAHETRERKNRTHSGHCVTWHPSSPGGQTLCTGPGSSWWGRRHASRASWRWQSPGAGKQPRVSPSMDLMAHLKWQNNEVCSKAIISLHSLPSSSPLNHICRLYSSATQKVPKTFNNISKTTIKGVHEHK